jgi:predicted nucleic acid-binding Zn ribbon protein
MYCNKCGRQIPEGSQFCSSCGTQIAGEGKPGQTKAKATSMFEPLAQLIKLDPVMAILSVGSLLLLLGPFLAWVDGGRGPAMLGIQTTNGVVILAAGVLVLVALVLSRTGTPGAWGIVMLLLSALALALVFQSMYYLNNQDADLTIREGVYISMVGALVAGGGGGLEYYNATKK